MEYFTMRELTRSRTAQRLGIDNTPPAEAVEQLRLLVDHVLDPLRKAYGRPIHVNSGYRCPALNRAVGGAPRSQHMRGQAADITAGSPTANRRLLQLIRTHRLPVDQVIDEHGGAWLHVSHSANPRRQFLSVV